MEVTRKEVCGMLFRGRTRGGVATVLGTALVCSGLMGIHAIAQTPAGEMTPRDAKGVTLTQGGKAKGVIVLPDAPSAPDKEAADLVQRTVQKMTGAVLPIVAESKAGGGPSEDRPWVSVGQTRFAQSQRLGPAAFKPEELRVTVAATCVILIGNESPNDVAEASAQWGTYYAAVEFLERLGVRWLWPGSVGEVIPKTADLSVAPYAYAFAPRLFQRHLRFEAPPLGEFLYQASIEKDGLAPGDWPQKMRLGYSRRIKATHAFGDWYEKYFKTHPEYFAVGEDEKSFGWFNNPERCKLCLSNPGTQNQVTELVREYYKQCKNPELAMFSLSPTDNQAGHCMCRKCRAADPPNGPRVQWNWYDKGGGRRSISHVSLTDRHVKFWNLIAERVEKDCPGLLLGAYAYGVYRHPPVQTDVRRNVAIGYVGISYTNDAVRREGLKHWTEWAKRAPTMFFRPNCLKDGRGFPLVFAKRMAEDIKYFAEHNMMATDIPNAHGHYATQGLNYYVLCKMLWDPSADVEAIIRDFCEKGFGAGAGEVRKYLARLMELTDQFAEHAARIESDPEKVLRGGEATREEQDAVQERKTEMPSPWAVVYAPETMRGLEGYLTRAAEAVKADPDSRKRVEFLQEGFEYAKVALPTYQRLEYMKAHEDSKEARFVALAALLDEEEWRRQHAKSNAIGIVTGVQWWHQLFLRTPLARLGVETKAQPAPGQPGTYHLTLLAWARESRIAQMQFSVDRNTWSPPEPYTRTKVWQGTGKRLFVRFLLLSPGQNGKTSERWSPPFPIDLGS